MQTIVFVILIGLMGGVAVGLQSPLASLIGQRLGILESVFIVHLGGAIAALIPLLALSGGNLSQWRTVPWYALGAGAFGLMVIGSVSYVIPRAGATISIILIVAGQLMVGTALDHFGLLGVAVRPLELTRVVGLVIIFGGVWLVVR